jgi:hypothetical protein
MKEAVFEFLNRVNAIEDEGQRAAALRAEARNVHLFDLLHYGLSPNIKFVVPPGTPPFREADAVTTHPNFWSDLRRLYLFVEGGKTLPDARQQTLFIQILEFIHPKDAAVLLDMKDRKWPYDNISAEFVEKIFPGLLGMYVTPTGVRRNG